VHGESVQLAGNHVGGAGVNSVLGRLFPAGEEKDGHHKGTVVLAALEGDVHDLGKNLVRTVLRTRGFHVVDLGKNVSIETIIEGCKKEKPLAVGISGLLTLVVPQVKKLRPALEEAGLDRVLVLAGGAALKQGTPGMLNVDFVAESVFDGVNFLEHATERAAGNHGPAVSNGKPTALENIARTLQFERTSKPPVIAQLFGHAARHAGLTLRDYRQSGVTVAECQLAARAAYGHDAVFAVMDLSVEAEALGAELSDPADAYADIIRHPLASPREVRNLELPNPEKDGRMPEILRACRRLRREVRENFPVVGGVLGPVTLASQLLGLETFLFALHDDPDSMDALLDFCTSAVISFGIAQLRAGAHLPLVLDPASSPAVLPPDIFRRHAVPRLRRIFHEFSKNKSIASWLLITGPTLPILPDLPFSGANLINLDYCVPAAAARSTLPQMAFNGNISPLAFVECTPSQIAHDVQILLETFQPGGGWILSAGCEIPPEAHPQNIVAMVQALHES
jgi:uroporphyrinogen decarboxylase